MHAFVTFEPASLQAVEPVLPPSNPGRVCRGALLLSLGFWFMGCATYSQDLQRAKQHYLQHDFSRALAVLRLLGEDLDALTEAEQVEYAYVRGMADLRLSALASDPELRRALRACARDWLDRAVRAEAASRQRLLVAVDGERARTTLAGLADVQEPPGACLGD